MANPALTVDQNILPVQAYFNLDGSFNTFIGQGQPFLVPGTDAISITNVPTLNATLYPTFSLVSSGMVTNLDVSASAVTFNPSTGIFTAPTFQGGLSGTASSATSLAGGTNFSLVYQSSSGNTAFLANGTTGQVLSANTSGVPTWTTLSLSGATVSDDTTTNSTRYPIFSSNTSGNFTLAYTSSTKYQYNPSTGTLSATAFSGSGASLTSLNASQVSSGTLGTGYGGTGLTAYATGDIVYASATNTLSKLAASTNGYVLTLAAGIPTWAASTGGVTSFQTSLSGLTPSTSTTGAVTLAGTLGVSSGGTGATTAAGAYNAITPLTTTGDLVYEQSAGVAARLPIGSTNQVLTVIGGVPAWANSTGGVTTFSAGTTGFTPSTASTGAVTLAGILNVANGGTGASTLTGYIYGNGTSAMTASLTIPTTALSGTVTNAQLANSAITINGNAVSLGGSTTVTASTTSALTIGTGLSGTSFNGSSPVTIALANTAVTAGSYTNTNITVDAQGRITTASSGSAGGVTTFSGGTTGLTPATATTGAITLGGTLVVSNGGTGLTSLTAGYIPYGAGTSALASYSGFNYNTTYNTLGTPTLSVTSTTSTTPALTFNAANTNVASGAAVSGSYLQSLFQNSSNTAGASVNYVLSNNLGTDSSYYGEFGMNSSSFSASTPVDFYSINNGIYFSGHDGDISVGSGNGYKLYLTYGTTGQYAHVINASGAIGLTTNLGTTPALSGTTGFGTAGQVLTSQGSSAPPTWNSLTASYSRTTQTATASQTTFSVTYTAPYIAVYLNGVLLNAADYTATNGTTVVLSTGAGAGDILDFVAYNTVSIGAAAGSNTQVQYNNSGALGASSGFTFDGINLNIPFGTSGSATSTAKMALALAMIA